MYSMVSVNLNSFSSHNLWSMTICRNQWEAFNNIDLLIIYIPKFYALLTPGKANGLCQTLWSKNFTALEKNTKRYNLVKDDKNEFRT